MKEYTIDMHGSEWYFPLKIGIKKYEGRCNWKTAAMYRVGDILCFYLDKVNNPDSFKAKIIYVHHFPTFEAALNKLPICDVLPGIDNVEDGVEIYKKYVSIETQNLMGIVMIEIERILITI